MEAFKRVKREPETYFNLQQTADDDVKRELRDAKPAHFLLKINNFSLLSSNPKIDKYESTDFLIGGCEWKLCVHPKGNKKVNEDKHISLYLALSKSNRFTLYEEVNVYFKLFVYNQIQDMYLTLQDAKWRVKRFRGMKTEWGFDQVLPISVFNDASNGYLIDDCCIFGAEVYVLFKTECESKDLSNNTSSSNFRIMPDHIKQTCKLESASVVKDHLVTYVWNVENFEEMGREYFEATFGSGKWNIELYPRGLCNGVLSRGKSLSVVLQCVYDLKAQQRLHCHYILRVKNQLNERHYEIIGDHQFKVCSKKLYLADFMPLSKLKDTEGYVVNNRLLVEVEFPLIVMLDI